MNKTIKLFIFTIVTAFIFVLLLVPNTVKASSSGPAVKISVSFKTPINKTPKNMGSVSLSSLNAYERPYTLYFQEVKWFKYDSSKKKYVQTNNLSEKFNKNNKYALSVSYLITQEASPWREKDGTWYNGLVITVNGKSLNSNDSNIYTNGCENKIFSKWKNPENGYVGYCIDTIFYELSNNEIKFEEVTTTKPTQPKTTETTPSKNEKEKTSESKTEKEKTEEVKKEYTVVTEESKTIVTDKTEKVSIKIDANIKNFETVYLDGKEVDKIYYDITEGSTIVTFKDEFIKTLSVGKHDLKFSFKDGEAVSSLTIETKEETTNKKEETSINEATKTTGIKEESIKTTDNSKTMGIAILALVAIAIVAALIILIKGKNKNNTANNTDETQDNSPFKNE